MRESTKPRRNLRAFAVVCALALFIPVVGSISYVSLTFAISPQDGDTLPPASGFEHFDLSGINITFREYLSDLEISLLRVEYYGNISKVFRLSVKQLERLVENGFIVVDSRGTETFMDAYRFYWENDLPVYITTDTILNTFHLLFDEFLKDAEKNVFGPVISDTISRLLHESIRLRELYLDSDLQHIIENSVIFFGVPSELMETGHGLPSYAKEEIREYVEKITKAEEVVIEEPPSPGQKYLEYEDYTQYKPRGHYAGDPYLEKYFRTMMWLGRRSYDLNKTEKIPEACLLSLILLRDPVALANWKKVYDITSYLVGRSDSLNAFDMIEAMRASTGGTEIELLADQEHILRIREELKKDKYQKQRILSTVIKKYPEELYKQLVFPKIFQFMGQRYVPDSEIMQHVMYDRVPIFNSERRGLPSSLDVMAAFGSPRAVEHLMDELKRYNYSEQLGDAMKSVREKSIDYWNQSIYFGVLRSYGELISGVENDDYPEFMRTAAWADEKLNSALGSWTELKHDTILYAKQPYSPGAICSTPDGLVEPYPAFYARMENLSLAMGRIVVENFDVNKWYVRLFDRAFRQFANINHNLTSISIHELRGIPLTNEETEFVRGVFAGVFEVCGGPVYAGWLPSLLETAHVGKGIRDTRIVADVATDSGTELPVPSPPRVLHVATGYIRSLIVAHEKPEGGKSFFVGPVYSFYEFPLEGFTRLNDEEWRDLLTSEDRPSYPSWTSSFAV